MASAKARAQGVSVLTFVIAVSAAFFLGKDYGMSIFSAAENTVNSFESPESLIYAVVLILTTGLQIYKTFVRRRKDD